MIRKRHTLIIILILLLAAIVRLWGIGFGLPHTGTRHDEHFIVDEAMHFGLGDFNPHIFNYPTLYQYILFILYAGYFIFGTIIGRFANINAFITEYALNPTVFYLINRLISAFTGIATVWVIYRLGLELFNKRAALLGAFFLAFAYLHVKESHFGKVDVAATFLTMCGLLFIVRIKDTKLSSYILAGFFSGLAATTKYTGVFLLLPLFISHYFIKLRKHYKVAISIVAFLFGFIIGTPFALLDFKTFYAGIALVSENSQRPLYDVWISSGWIYHIKISLYHGLGWSMFISSIAGIVLMLRNDFRKAFFLISFPIAYYILIGNTNAALARYAIPVVPFLTITAAYFIDRVGQITGNKSVVYLLSLLVILPSLLNIIKFDNLLAKKDNRLIATDWVYTNLDRGSSIYQVGSWLGTMQLLPSIYSLSQELEPFEVESINKEQNIKRMILKERITYMQKLGRNGFDMWVYQKEPGKFSFNKIQQPGLPHYVIIYETPLIIDKNSYPIDANIQLLINQHYKLIKSFKVIDINNENNVFEHQDAFYLPFVGFRGIDRPGPNIFIYKKT